MKLVLLVGVLISVNAFAASDAFFSALNRGQTRMITDSQFFQKALHALLSKNWALGSSSLVVDETPGKRKRVTDAAKLKPEEIGISIGSGTGGVYAGPYQIGQGKDQYVFVMTVDSRSYGYDHDRYYVIYRKLEALDETPSEIESISSKRAYRVKENVQYPLPSGYSPLNEAGKTALIELSNKNWIRSIQYDVPSIFSDSKKVYRSTWKHSFHFGFWNDFKRMNYSMKLEQPNRENSVGPFQDSLPVLFTMGERVISPGIHEYAIIAGNTWAMYQSANQMTVVTANEDFFNTKSWDQADKELLKRVPNDYWFPGFERSRTECEAEVASLPERNRNAKTVPNTIEVLNENTYRCTHPLEAGGSADAGLIVLRVDESKPNSLEVRYELTDPRVEGLTNSFQAD